MSLNENNDEEDILNDFNQSPLLEIFSYDYAYTKLTEWLDELKNVTEPNKLIESDLYCAAALKASMISCMNIIDRKDVLDEFRKENRINQFIDVYIWLLKNYQSIDFERTKPEPKPPFTYCYDRLTVNERCLHLMCELSFCVNNLFVGLIDARVYAIQHGILKCLVMVLDDEAFLSKMDSFNPRTVGLFVFNVNWLSKIAEAYKSEWHELDAIRVLMKMCNVYPNLCLYLYMAVANIAYDKEIETLVEIHQAIDRFVELTNEGVANGRFLTSKQEFIDEENHALYQFDVITVIDDRNNATVSITGLLLSLYRLSVNDKIKFDLYEKPGLKDSLKNLVYTGNDVEKQYSLELLAQLCFDERVKKDLRSDTSFLEQTKALLNAPNEIEYKKLIKTCKQIIWLLTSSEETPAPEHKTEPSSDEKNNEQEHHIMISYNTASRDLCLRIKASLEHHGLKVWIDVDEIHGSSLESMARAVENAQCVLMCVTERYRQSLNCQAEAQYAFRLNKKIIPLIMQKGYGNVDGWLGFIIGDKIFIDFTKYDYDDCFKRVINQIQLLTRTGRPAAPQVARVEPMNRQMLSDNTDIDSASVGTTVAQTETSFSTTAIEKQHHHQPINQSRKAAMNWHEDQVENWLADSGLSTFNDILKPINGKVLYQLYQLQTHTPEFFFKSITQTKNGSLMDIRLVALFSSSLKDLFD